MDEEYRIEFSRKNLINHTLLREALKEFTRADCDNGHKSGNILGFGIHSKIEAIIQ